MIKQDETNLFKMLDNYSRARYRCFVAELFLNREQNEYVICFRPMDVPKESENRYACVYFRLGINQAKDLERGEMVLDEAITSELETKLRELSRMT